MNFSYGILLLDGCSEKLFPKQERERTSLSPPSSLSRVDVFNNNINCLQKTYSFLTSEQLLVSAFLRGCTASRDDFTEASYSDAQRGGDAGSGTWAVLGLRMLCQ